jgi:hypothetical protein
MAVILVTYQGAYAVAGLGWERSPERLSEARLGVRWGKAFAPVSELEHLGCPSLLSALFGAMPSALQNQTVLAAFADSASETYFGALVSDGEPVLEPERLFPSREELLGWIARESTQNGLQAIVLSQELKGRVASEVPVFEFGETAPEFSPVLATGRGTSFKMPRVLTKRSFLIAGGIALLMAATLPHAIGSWYGGEEVAPEQSTQVTVYTARDEAAFLGNCVKAFEEAWPIGPGWSRALSGCTGPGMLDVVGLGAQAQPVAFQIYRLRPGWDVTIARKAARIVLDASDDRVGGTADTLIVSRVIEAPMVESLEAPLGQAARAETDQQALEGAFLGKARSVRSLGDTFEITQWGLIGDMTKTLETLDWLEVASLERRDGLVTALVRPKQVTAVMREEDRAPSE